MTAPRRAAATVVTLLVVATAGCGAGDTVADPSRSASGSRTPTSTPTPPSTPAPTTGPKPVAKPLSAFENEAPVQAARRWAAALAVDVNLAHRTYPASKAVATQRAAGQMHFYGDEDVGLHYPGPLPFTPTQVRVVGNTATLAVCVLAQGWAEDPRTRRRTAPLTGVRSGPTVSSPRRWPESGSSTSCSRAGLTVRPSRSPEFRADRSPPTRPSRPSWGGPPNRPGRRDGPATR